MHVRDDLYSSDRKTNGSSTANGCCYKPKELYPLIGGLQMTNFR